MLTYLLLSDVNTLNAFVVGVTLTAFVIRVASTIQASISLALVSNIRLLYDVRSPVADVSTYAGAAAVHAAEACILFTVLVTATSVPGAGVLPYLEGNAYVLGVWNHLWLMMVSLPKYGAGNAIRFLECVRLRAC